jgi:quercetin dioxygenase-like cupin family protein
MIRQNLIPLLTMFLMIHSVAGHAQGTIVRKQLKLVEFDSRPVSKVDLREISLAPGQKGPLHKHPCPVVGYIVSGSILF